MQALDSLAQFIQSTFGSISFSTMDHRWFIVIGAVIVVLLIVFTQEKPKAISILIAIYGVWFVAMLVPAVSDSIEKNIPSGDLFIISTVLGALPIAALLVHRYKKGKKRAGGPVA